MPIFNAPRAYPKAYAPYYQKFNFYEGRDVWLESTADIPIKPVHLFTLHWLHAEVHNGGFWQYFFNSTGTCLPEAIDGFDAIGMPDVAEIIRNAANVLGTPYPFDKEARREIVGPPERRVDFSDFDFPFYEIADTNKFFRRKPKFVPFADAYALGV